MKAYVVILIIVLTGLTSSLLAGPYTREKAEHIYLVHELRWDENAGKYVHVEIEMGFFSDGVMLSLDETNTGQYFYRPADKIYQLRVKLKSGKVVVCRRAGFCIDRDEFHPKKRR